MLWVGTEKSTGSPVVGHPLLGVLHSSLQPRTSGTLGLCRAHGPTTSMIVISERQGWSSLSSGPEQQPQSTSGCLSLPPRSLGSPIGTLSPDSLVRLFIKSGEGRDTNTVKAGGLFLSRWLTNEDVLSCDRGTLAKKVLQERKEAR